MSRWDELRRLKQAADRCEDGAGWKYHAALLGSATELLAAAERAESAERDLAALRAEVEALRQRLDWLITSLCVIEMDHRGWYVRDENRVVAGFWKTPYEAIDAARKEQP